MPIKVEIDHQRKFVRSIASGEITLQEMEAHFDEIVVADALRYAKLFVALQADPHYSDHDVMMMGARLSAYTKTYENGPLAMVAVRRDLVDAFRRFVNISPASRPARLFDSEEAAMKWLGIPPK